MALRHITAGAATAGLVGALTALVLSTLPALAHEYLEARGGTMERVALGHDLDD